MYVHVRASGCLCQSQATDFVTAWSEAMECIAAKSAELKELEEVGADIDTVKTQLDEYKVYSVVVCSQSDVV